MAKKKEVTSKLTPKENAMKDIKDLLEVLSRCEGEPTYTFNVGDEVVCGSLENCVVDEVIENGKIIGFTYLAHSGHKGYSDYKEFTSYRYACWQNVRPKVVGDTSFTQNRDLRLNFIQQNVQSLISRHYNAGINFSPDYQRDSVWDDKDRELLLESIFLGADIGKFVFARYDDETWAKMNYKYGYEVVDGKQRLLTLIAFYENRFAYKGKYYNDLSFEDQLTFKRTLVSVGEVDNYDRKTILRIFIMLNRGGKVVEEQIIENAKKMLEEC